MADVELVWITPNAENLVVRMARVSSPKNLSAPGEKLIKYLIKHQHWSPFEMASACFSIKTSRAISRQILRHRSFSFQEFCISGDTKIFLDLPSGLNNGKRACYTRTIRHLYDAQEAGKKLPSCVRVFDEEIKTFVGAKIKRVFKTGIKPVYRIELANDRFIDCTYEHRVLTSSGFVSIGDHIRLSLANGVATFSNRDAEIGCNGDLAYQNKEWLCSAKERSIVNKTGVSGIASEAGVSYHTIRKWLRIHGLQFKKNEISSYTPIWNKGRYGYKNRPWSQESRTKHRLAVKRGSESNLWRGGVDREWRLKVADWCSSYRTEFLIKANHRCAQCGENKSLELHHIEPVWKRPDLAMVKENIQVLCRICHRTLHGTNGDARVWRQKHRGNTLTVCWSKVRSVKFLGEMETYDMEVDHISHNYVANGIVVHNSQRYSMPDDEEIIAVEARAESSKNRQSSIPLKDKKTHEFFQQRIESIRQMCFSTYRSLIEAGIAKEVARAVLPEGLTPSHLYMAGTLRSWRHFVELRTKEDTQQEHREIAESIRKILAAEAPIIFGSED